jgi:tetratricopeptide (TPR) repeat protein
MKATIKKRIRTLSVLLLTCSFLFSTGCSGLRDWWGHDASTANSDLNQFYYSVRPVKGTVESDYRLARYFQKRGKHKFAVDELLNAIRKDPSFIKAYNALGVSYDCLGQFDLAVKSYKFALQLNPELDYVHNNLGYSYLLNGDLDSAIDAFQKAIAIDGTKKRYHNNLALAYVRKGQTNMAYDEFKLASDDSKFIKTLKDSNQSEATKEAAVDTSPEGISPYDDIQKDKKASLFLATKDHEISSGNLEHRLIPDDLDEIDLLEKPINNEARNSDLNLSQEDTDKTENLVNYTVQVSASNNLKDASLLMEMLSKKGYPCPYLNKIGDERPYYRVRIGRFNDKEEIDQLIPDLTHILGYKPFIAVEDEQAKKILYGKTDCFNTKIDSSSVVTQPLYIEISNGNGVRHMARNMGIYLNPKGFNTNRLTNADHFNYPETKIYYQRGYEQEALRLAKEIPGRQEIPNLIEQNRLMRRSIKVLIGKDLVPFHKYIMSNIKSNPNVAKVEIASKKTG